MATNRTRTRNLGLYTRDGVRYSPVVNQTIYQKFYHNYKINIGLFHGITRWDVFFGFVLPIAGMSLIAIFTVVFFSSSLCTEKKLRWWPRDSTRMNDYGSLPAINQAMIVIADLQSIETELCMIWTMNSNELQILAKTDWTVPNLQAVPRIKSLTPTPGALTELQERKLVLGEKLGRYCDASENSFLQPIRTGGQRFFHRINLLEPSISHTLNMAHIRSPLIFWTSPTADEQVQNASCKLWTEMTNESLRASKPVVAAHEAAIEIQNLIYLDIATHKNVFHRAEYHNRRKNVQPRSLNDLSHESARAVITRMADLQTSKHEKISQILLSLRRLFDRWWFIAWAAGVQLEGRDCESFRIYKGTWEWLDQKFYSDEAARREGGGAVLERGTMRKHINPYLSDFAQRVVVSMAFGDMGASNWTKVDVEGSEVEH